MIIRISRYLSKPVDVDKLVYRLKSIFGGGTESRASPPHE